MKRLIELKRIFEENLEMSKRLINNIDLESFEVRFEMGSRSSFRRNICNKSKTYNGIDLITFEIG